jgi:5-methylcytosine-specific restriction endonuclease McrA
VDGLSILDDVIARDGPACVWCGRQPWRSDLTAEHLLPRARGGRGSAENLAVACRACNKRRRTRAVAAYVRAQLADGRAPRMDLLDAALSRLARSRVGEHAAYGARQRALLERAVV